MSHCPECEAVIDKEFKVVREMISCPKCGVGLEVISIDPLEFDLAPIDGDEDDNSLIDDSEECEEWDEDEDSSIADLESQIEEIKSKVSELEFESNVSDLELQVSELEFQVSDLESQVSDSKSKTNQLASRVNELESEVNDLMSAVWQGAIYSLGSIIAIAISWSTNHSILWAILHGIASWCYVIFYGIRKAGWI